MMRGFTALYLCLALGVGSASAQDDLIRLPGQGELKSEATYVKGIGRLIPGGGLLLSFDANRDGEITPTEITQGVQAAFIKADQNEDGRITPLEQIRWTETLPTRDVSLANPARFDPNLDRSVRNEEFSEIIHAFAAIHIDEATGNIPILNLKSAQQGRAPQQEPEFAPKRKNTGADKAKADEASKQDRPRRAGGS